MSHANKYYEDNPSIMCVSSVNTSHAHVAEDNRGAPQNPCRQSTQYSGTVLSAFPSAGKRCKTKQKQSAKHLCRFTNAQHRCHADGCRTEKIDATLIAALRNVPMSRWWLPYGAGRSRWRSFHRDYFRSPEQISVQTFLPVILNAWNLLAKHAPATTRLYFIVSTHSK